MQPVKRMRRLNQQLIIAEAVILLNEDGLEGLSLRRLANRLQVSAPSIYRHFPDKSELLSGVLDTLFYEVLFSIPEHAEPGLWMQDFGQRMWQKMMDVRDYGRLVLVAQIKPQQVEKTVAAVQARLSHLGMPGNEALNLQSSIQALLIGWAAFAHSPFGSTLQNFVPIRELAMRDMQRLIEAYGE